MTLGWSNHLQESSTSTPLCGGAVPVTRIELRGVGHPIPARTCPYARMLPTRHATPISITLPDGGPSIGAGFQIVVFNYSS